MEVHVSCIKFLSDHEAHHQLPELPTTPGPCGIGYVEGEMKSFSNLINLRDW